MELIALARLEWEEAIAPCLCVEERYLMGQDDLLLHQRMGLSTETCRAVPVLMGGMVQLATVRPQRWVSP
jgi:hypothetical protein